MQPEHIALPRTMVMPNGVLLHVLDGAGHGLVRFDILFGGGYAVQDKPLQAMFTNRMLREGAGELTAAEISRRLDYYGAWIDMYSSQNCNHITLYSMSKHLAPLLHVLEALVKYPLFPEDNLETVKSNNKAHFRINSQKVDVVSQRYFENALWGEGHPLGHVITADDYDSITREDLSAYYAKVYGSRNCVMFVSGSVDEEMLSDISASFGNEDWGCGSSMEAAVVMPPVPEYGRRTITIPDTMQSAVKIGFMALDSMHPDFNKFRFLCVLLGGYFGSRLMSNIREENGYTYHIAAEMDAYGQRNAFMISSEAANEYVAPLIDEVYKEIDALLTEPVSVEEIELVRNYILGELCREYEGVSAKTEVFINAWLSGAGFESVNSYIDELTSVTPAELMRVARENFIKGRMIEIVAGA